MNAKIRELKNSLQNGMAASYVLSPDTLYAILHEIENMCVSTDTIEAKPVDNGQPGFWLRVKGSEGVDTPYVMGSQAATGGGGNPYSDTWSSATGGTTNGTNAVAGAFNGVQYDGPRIVITDTTAKLGGINNGNPDGVYAIQCNVSIFRRSMTFTSGGILTAIGAEDEESVEIVQLDANYLLP